MDQLQFLTWVRGPGLNLALLVFVLGVLWRLVEIYGLGRKQDLSAPRSVSGASGWATIVRRMAPPSGVLKASPVTYIGGYVFHVGLAVVVFLFAPHIAFVTALVGISWPALPSQVIDFATVVTMAGMVAVLVDRHVKWAKRFLSTFGDWFAWLLTFLPLLTGWLAEQHMLLPYTMMLALHILSVELLLVCLPFTKLIHAFTTFGSRWFNGTVNGHKGVPV
jgi:nitrate reductase gamma subunit